MDSLLCTAPLSLPCSPESIQIGILRSQARKWKPKWAWRKLEARMLLENIDPCWNTFPALKAELRMLQGLSRSFRWRTWSRRICWVAPMDFETVHRRRQQGKSSHHQSPTQTEPGRWLWTPWLADSRCSLNQSLLSIRQRCRRLEARKSSWTCPTSCLQWWHRRASRHRASWSRSGRWWSRCRHRSSILELNTKRGLLQRGNLLKSTQKWSFQLTSQALKCKKFKKNYD